MIKTTLAAIRSLGPCEEGLIRLETALGPYWPAEAEIPLERIVETNGVADAIWALRACGPEAERISRLFSCDCADRALALIPRPDPRSVEAVAVSRRFADGAADHKELTAARAAAGDAAGAAWDAARATARAAARAAANAAANAAAGAAWDAAGAAWDAARDAARAAAWDAAWDAARAAGDAAGAAGDAARAAAWDAAWDAERKWQRERLLQYLGG